MSECREGIIISLKEKLRGAGWFSEMQITEDAAFEMVMQIVKSDDVWIETVVDGSDKRIIYKPYRKKEELETRLSSLEAELKSANEAIDAYTEWDRQTRYSKLHGEHCECPLCEHLRRKYPKKEG